GIGSAVDGVDVGSAAGAFAINAASVHKGRAKQNCAPDYYNAPIKLIPIHDSPFIERAWKSPNLFVRIALVNRYSCSKPDASFQLENILKSCKVALFQM
ncbi:MAG: hypothetical protein WCH43_15145, partial [Verrucomicrobiota bacterium]